MKRQGSSKGGKLPVLECHKGQGEEKLFAYTVLLYLGFRIVSTKKKKSQNMRKIVQPEILKYTLQTGKYALNTHTHTEIYPFIYIVYSLILVTVSSAYTTDFYDKKCE